jgi:hypothetical protein
LATCLQHAQVSVDIYTSKDTIYRNSTYSRVSYHTACLLLGKGWLNDEAIHAAMFKDLGGDYVFNTFFFTKLIGNKTLRDVLGMSATTINYENVKRWMKPERLKVSRERTLCVCVCVVVR